MRVLVQNDICTSDTKQSSCKVLIKQMTGILIPRGSLIHIQQSHYNPWWPLWKLLSRYHTFKSSYWNSVEDQQPKNEIYRSPIFKWVALTWQGWEGTSRVLVLAMVARVCELFPLKYSQVLSQETAANMVTRGKYQGPLYSFLNFNFAQLLHSTFFMTKSTCATGSFYLPLTVGSGICGVLCILIIQCL